MYIPGAKKAQLPSERSILKKKEGQEAEEVPNLLEFEFNEDEDQLVL